MKNLLKIFTIICCAISTDAFSCGSDYTPYIDGPAEVDQNATATYKHVFDSYYRNASGGYSGTEWTLTGKGVVGYGESIVVNFAGLAPGNYVLTAKNAFGFSCYGCLTNTTFSKTIKVVPLRPDFKVEIVSTIPNPLTECKETQTLSYKVSNIGTATAPAANVKIFWIKEADQFLSSNEVTVSIPAGGFYQVNNTTFRTPCTLTDGETWTFTIFVDPDNTIAEKNESNNTATAERKINKAFGGLRIAQEDTTPTDLITVSDSYGNVVWERGLSAFDFNSLRNGMYLYKFKNGQMTTIKKVVKQ